MHALFPSFSYAGRRITTFTMIVFVHCLFWYRGIRVAEYGAEITLSIWMCLVGCCSIGKSWGIALYLFIGLLTYALGACICSLYMIIRSERERATFFNFALPTISWDLPLSVSPTGHSTRCFVLPLIRIISASARISTGICTNSWLHGLCTVLA